MRVAVVGAGPSGIYCAEALAARPNVEVDVFETLPVPFGLVRYGVAPDHLSIRSVRDKLSETFENSRVNFRGNVEIGRDITANELSDWYDAVIYTYGAAADRKLGIPGEECAHSIAATDFVKWYTGHPDARSYADLLASSRSVCVIGLGNVAVDVARLLLKPVEQLRQTDIPDHVLEAFAASAVREVHIVGRRGPQHATFTTKELKELGEIPDASVVVRTEDLPTDDDVASEGNRVTERNLKVLREWSAQPVTTSDKMLYFHFYSTPIEYNAEQKLLRVECMALDPNQGITTTGRFEDLPADSLIRSVGYRGIELEGLPFDESNYTIPSSEGKVASSRNSYVAGWIKRGPSGIIGTNKKDAVATVETLMLHTQESESTKSLEDVDAILRERGIKFVDFKGWLRIDSAEKNLGAEQGRERTTIHDRASLLRIGIGDQTE